MKTGYTSITDIFLGVEVTENDLHVMSYPGNFTWQFDNDDRGISEFSDMFLEVAPKLIVVQENAGFETMAAAVACGFGQSVAIVAPSKRANSPIPRKYSPLAIRPRPECWRTLP